MGSFIHVVKRGARGTNIVRDVDDKNRFLLMLAHLNDQYQPNNWFRDIRDNKHSMFDRPSEWPRQKKIVHILAFCLLNNHFHLLLEEIEEGGISRFMQRTGTAMANHFNEKYEEQGSLFQGAYRSRTISRDSYLRYVLAYIQLKNAFDALRLAPSARAHDFDLLYEKASLYPYSSLGDHLSIVNRPVIERNLLLEFMPAKEFRTFSRDFVEGRVRIPEEEHEAVYLE